MDLTAARLNILSERKNSRATFIFWASRTVSTSIWRRRIYSFYHRIWNRLDWRPSKPWPAKFPWWPPTWADCRKSSSTELTDIFLRRERWISVQDTPWKYCLDRIAAGKWARLRG